MKRIMVIDDEVQFREMIRQVLEHAGYEVSEAADGKEGIELFRREPADLIITDIVMPEKEGLETIMDLRRDFPQVKVIAVSGGGRMPPEGYLRLAKNLGAKRTLAKPFRKEELLQAVGEVVQGNAG